MAGSQTVANMTGMASRSRTSSQSTVRHRSAQVDEGATVIAAPRLPRSHGVSSNCP